VILLLLFAEFFYIGLFSVGGGLATLPFLYRLADKYDWLDYHTIADMVAVAESTPGAIGVNMSTYTGFQCAGIPGAVIATLGLVSPSIVVILIVARLLQTFKESALVTAVFSGLRPAAVGLIAAAGFGVIKLSLYNPAAHPWYAALRLRETLLFAALFLLIYRFKRHPVVYIALAGAAGIALGL
jgi:chromate transporter